MPFTPSNSNARKYTTISIPTPLFQQVEKKIDGTGFRSATEFIVYVTRVAIAEENPSQSPMDANRPTRRFAPEGVTATAREELPFR